MSTFKVTLFDLDGTLLPMQMDSFLKAYFNKLSGQFATMVDPQRLVRVLLAATDAMIDNTDAAKTNEEVFREYFFGKIDADPAQMMPDFEQFYTNVFPELRVHTQPTPVARQVLKAAMDAGHDLVLATNPVFPRIAIEERMRWARIDDLPFTLITDYEGMHFCKPRLQYYNEIITRIGAAPHDCLMVGNDLAADMVAARLGLSTYLVEDCLITNGGDPTDIHHRGRLDDLLKFFRQPRPEI